MKKNIGYILLILLIIGMLMIAIFIPVLRFPIILFLSIITFSGLLCLIVYLITSDE